MLRDKFEYGTGAKVVELVALVPLRVCAECAFEFTDSEAEDLRHEAVCHHLGLMTPTDIRGLRNRYGLTRAQFAEKTRIGEASLARWETGELFQTAANDNYLFLLTFPDNLELLDGRYEGEHPKNEEQSVVKASAPVFRGLDPDDVVVRRQEAAMFLTRYETVTEVSGCM